MILTIEQLVEAGLADRAVAAVWIDGLNEACERFSIDTPERAAAFVAQCSHESGHFKATVENLNYSADALARVWPSRFRRRQPGEAEGIMRGADGKRIAEDYARKPELIANAAYSDRMGNGDEASGDGWRHRGMGLIQLTGKANHMAYLKQVGAEEAHMEDPMLISKPPHAALSAGWFWMRNGLNALADARDIVGMTKRINGGTIGLEDRQKLYAAALSEIVSA
jgi:putative chitinase